MEGKNNIMNLDKEVISKFMAVNNLKELTAIWQDRGIITPKEYAILTSELYKNCLGEDKYKYYRLSTKKRLIDFMTDSERDLISRVKALIMVLTIIFSPYGVLQNKEIVKLGCRLTKSTMENKQLSLL